MSSIIRVRKRDESLVHFACDDSGVLHEISEYFTFYAEGYKYMPAYRNKMWDGKVRLANLRNNSLPYGLIGQLDVFAESRGYKIQYELDIKQFNVPEEQELLDYIDTIEITVNSEPAEMRDYQIDGFIHCMQKRRALLISPTGSGKSLIIYAMLRWYLDNVEDGKSVLIVVPTTGLVEQMKKDFANYSEFDENFDAEKEVHQIYSGKEKFNFSSRVVVTTWQSAVKLPKDWFQNFGMVIGDEAHQFKAKSLNDIMSNLTVANYRIGTTGTIDDIRSNQLTLIGNFGDVHKVISTRELMDSGALAKLKINCLVLNYPDEIRKAVCKCDYQAEMDYIVTHAGRNNFIKNLACDLKGNTLVLFNYVDKHGKPLYRDITKQLEGTNKKSFYVSGEVKTIDREIIRELADTFDNMIHLEFGQVKIKIRKDSLVRLSDGTEKLAPDVTMTDDVCDLWIAAKIK